MLRPEDSLISPRLLTSPSCPPPPSAGGVSLFLVLRVRNAALPDPQPWPHARLCPRACLFPHRHTLQLPLLNRLLQRFDAGAVRSSPPWPRLPRLLIGRGRAPPEAVCGAGSVAPEADRRRGLRSAAGEGGSASPLKPVIQYQTVRYDILPLSKVSRERLNQVKRKILVLDLDETLIHSHHDGVLRPTVRPGTPPDFILKVVIDKHPVRFFVHKRPHVDFFLEVVSQWYELVVFTASMEIYGSAVADKLDNNRSILKRRYYRQHCTLELGSYIKDLSVVHNDLSSIVILDNSPGAYRSHPDNAIPIKSWFSDPSDTALLNLLPMLDALRFTADVRSVLSRNLHQHRLW
uniref:CTD nuclear envelope phosphatase 1 isoform X1 n=1 Tax=Podarcis muralis TaxID=64176 RepID=UPI0010A06864|nr:CTD nuclear envelope phosphatase 1 isoform X1 [Podarcis muralis]